MTDAFSAKHESPTLVSDWFSSYDDNRMHSILDGLNAAQKAAVTSEADVLQILAPPGSGKTKTLTARVAYLLQYRDYKPWNIICLTFTIKSSREMRDRISKLLGNGVEAKLVLGTFHSVCRRYLVTYGHLIGIRKGFGIADTSDTIAIIKRIIKRRRLNVDARKAQTRISHTKSKGISHVELAHNQGSNKNVEQQEFITVFEDYENQLKRSNLLDYDDLLLQCVDLLTSHPSCVSNVQSVLIDEFQDTNVVQFDLMRLFASERKSITTVGDPDQSIYGWRSAQIRNLKRMQKQYPDTLVIHLEENYRSSGAILLAAREVIEQDQSRPQKPLLPTHCPGTVPVLRRLPSAEIEAAWITSEIQRTLTLTGNLLAYSDFAVLLRSASLSRLIESSMGKAGIPYCMIGGHRFYDRVEIKILLDYLRVISQPDNNDAVARIINVPTRGIGEATVKSMLEEAEVKRSTLWQLTRNIIQGYTKPHLKISKAAENGLGTFSSLIINCKNRLLDLTNLALPEDLLRHLIKKLGFKAYLEKTYPEDHELKWANVEELVAQAADYSMRVSKEGEEDILVPAETDDALPVIEGLDQREDNVAEDALSRLLANVALATEVQRDDDNVEGGRLQSQVSITTIHSAKGLEWPVVFVPSAYDGCIPHSRAEDTDEERRLLYVAMTRAQALLYMSCPIKTSQREEATLSPFLSDKKVRHLLSSNDPAIDTGVVIDISRILRRSCPSKNDMVDRTQILRSREDNLWPLDGSESVETISSRQSKWDKHYTNEVVGPAFKKRRTTVNSNVIHLNAHTVDVGVTTTMQNPSVSSSNCNTGFTTASVQMHAMRDQGGDTGNERPKMIKEPSTLTTNKEVSDQRSLIDSWRLKPKFGKTREQIGAEVMQSGPSAPPIVAPKQMIQSEAREVQTSNVRIPLSTMPQPLADHRLLRNVISCRAPRGFIGETQPSDHYVFLSSSPPPTDDIHETTMKDHHKVDIEVSGRPNALAHQPNHHQRVESSSTFHTTTVSQIRTALPRKTLGVRRSMAGWNAGGRQSFTVPKKTDGNR